MWNNFEMRVCFEAIGLPEQDFTVNNASKMPVSNSKSGSPSTPAVEFCISAVSV